MKNATLPCLAVLLVTSACADEPDPAIKGAELLAPFKANLKAALVEGMQQGPETAIEVCSDKAPEIAASLSAGSVTMGRSSHRLRNPDNEPPEWLAPYLEEWNKGEVRSVELPDGRQGYAEPIFIQPLCLTCHGAELSPGIAAQIEALYPDDQATGYSEGDFRGVFWVEF